jgi:hypothetical protein
MKKMIKCNEVGLLEISDAVEGNEVYERWLRKIPEQILSEFTPSQLNAIELAIRQTKSRHRLHFRVSFPWFGHRTYVALMAGKERRSIERLRLEGQMIGWKIAASYGAVISAIAGALLLSGAVLMFSMYKITENDNYSYDKIYCGSSKQH